MTGMHSIYIYNAFDIYYQIIFQKCHANYTPTRSKWESMGQYVHFSYVKILRSKSYETIVCHVCILPIYHWFIFWLL